MSAHFDQIKSTFDRFSAAWKTNDGAAVVSFFVEDGALINPFGQSISPASAPLKTTTPSPMANRPSTPPMARSSSSSTSPRCCVTTATAGASSTVGPTPSRPSPAELPRGRLAQSNRSRLADRVNSRAGISC